MAQSKTLEIRGLGFRAYKIKPDKPSSSISYKLCAQTCEDNILATTKLPYTLNPKAGT